MHHLAAPELHTSPLAGEVDAHRAAGEGLPKPVKRNTCRAAEDAHFVWPHSKLPAPPYVRSSVFPSSGASRHLLPQGEKGFVK